MSCLIPWRFDFDLGVMSTSLEQARVKRRGKRIALILATIVPVLAGTAYSVGWFFDCEYVHWPTIWHASRAETPAGIRVANLVRAQTAHSKVTPHWHHCGWCATVYSQAKHVAIKVTISANEAFLFDWDASTRRLLPLTVRTAERFPELIPAGFIMDPLSEGRLDGQLHTDRACRIIAKTQKI